MSFFVLDPKKPWKEGKLLAYNNLSDCLLNEWSKWECMNCQNFLTDNIQVVDVLKLQIRFSFNFFLFIAKSWSHIQRTLCVCEISVTKIRIKIKTTVNVVRINEYSLMVFVNSYNKIFSHQTSTQRWSQFYSYFELLLHHSRKKFFRS